MKSLCLVKTNQMHRPLIFFLVKEIFFLISERLKSIALIGKHFIGHMLIRFEVTTVTNFIQSYYKKAAISSLELLFNGF